MRIRNKKSFVVVGPEGQAPKSIWSRLTHALYLLFLALLAIYLIYFTFTRFTQFKVDGQVAVERVRVAALQGGRIATLKVKAGDRVVSGEQIVVLETNQQCAAKSDKAIRKLRQSIALDKQRLKGLKLRRDKSAARKQQLIDERRLGRVLELERRKQTESQSLQRLLDEMDVEIEILTQEIELQQQELELQLKSHSEVEDCGFERIAAPVDGDVIAVNYHLHEIVNRKETILILVPRTPEVWVDAFTRADDQLPVLSGQSVNVRLPDGTLSRAEVSSLKSAAVPFPDRKFDDYTPKESALHLRVKPINSEEAKRWLEFDRMAVTVEGER
ncbi:MAG: efflux RND transporter periplasmic adaptor subunit [Candidatus Thiodiazotropha taylori]|nr:efflux RND transporter periplasmic adaptor subunit [Candidatus Thiodiazotropha taylori]